MISERTLRKWRRDALKCANDPLYTFDPAHPEKTNLAILQEKQYNERILRLTQELMDLILLRKG